VADAAWSDVIPTIQQAFSTAESSFSLNEETCLTAGSYPSLKNFTRLINKLLVQGFSR
jgi:hypothetical protein